MKTTGRAKPQSLTATIAASACGAAASRTASSPAPTVKEAAHTAVMITLVRRKSGLSQTAGGAVALAMPRVKGLRTASEPQAVRASQPRESAVS